MTSTHAGAVTETHRAQPATGFHDVLKDAILHLLQHQPDDPIPWLARHFELLAGQADAVSQVAHLLAAARSKARDPAFHDSFMEVVAAAYDKLAADHQAASAAGSVTSAQLASVLQLLPGTAAATKESAASVPASTWANNVSERNALSAVSFKTFGHEVKSALCAEPASESCHQNRHTQSALPSFLLPSMLMGPHK